MMYTLYDRMETYHIGDQRSPVSRQLWELEAVSSNLASPTTLEYSSIGQSIRLIRGRLKVRFFLFQHTSAQCNGSIPVSKTVCKGSNPLVGANWFFGVTDSTKRYGRFSKGSNPLGTTIGWIVREARRWSAKPFTLVQIQYPPQTAQQLNGKALDS